MSWPKGVPRPPEVTARQQASRDARRAANPNEAPLPRASMSLSSAEVAWMDDFLTASEEIPTGTFDAGLLDALIKSPEFGNLRRMFSRVNDRNRGRAGFERARKGGPKIDHSKRVECWELRKSGMTLLDVSTKTGFAVSTVHRVCREMGRKAG